MRDEVASQDNSNIALENGLRDKTRDNSFASNACHPIKGRATTDIAGYTPPSPKTRVVVARGADIPTKAGGTVKQARPPSGAVGTGGNDKRCRLRSPERRPGPVDAEDRCSGEYAQGARGLSSTPQGVEGHPLKKGKPCLCSKALVRIEKTDEKHRYRSPERYPRRQDVDEPKMMNYLAGQRGKGGGPGAESDGQVLTSVNECYKPQNAHFAHCLRSAHQRVEKHHVDDATQGRRGVPLVKVERNVGRCHLKVPDRNPHPIDVDECVTTPRFHRKREKAGECDMG